MGTVLVTQSTGYTGVATVEGNSFGAHLPAPGAMRLTTGRAVPSTEVHTAAGAAASATAHSFNDPSREAGKEA